MTTTCLDGNNLSVQKRVDVMFPGYYSHGVVHASVALYVEIDQNGDLWYEVCVCGHPGRTEKYHSDSVYAHNLVPNSQRLQK